MTELDPRLSDDDAQKVLARAMEVQAHNAGALTVAQIREIASELSIPESAVDQALLEYRAAAALSPPTDPTAAQRSWKRHRVARRTMIAMALGGGAFVLLVVLSFIMRLFP
jgi:hypothetical protein